MFKSVLIISMLLFSVTITQAANLVVPQQDSLVEGSTNNVLPFLNVMTMRYQQLYAASQFTQADSDIEITKIAFRPDGELLGSPFSVTLSSVQIDLSTTTNDSLNPVFDTNTGVDDLTVFPKGPLTLPSAYAGPKGGPKDFDIFINLTTPFIYNPANGNLLLDVRNSSDNTVEATAFDCENGALFNNAVSRQSADNVTQTTASVSDTYGLVTQFIYVAVPEPAHIFLLVVGAIALLIRPGIAKSVLT
jgi:hypothetical protein